MKWTVGDLPTRHVGAKCMLRQVSCVLCLTLLDPRFSVLPLQGMPTQKPAPKAGPGRAREVSRVRRRRGPQAGQQQHRSPVSALGGTPPAPPSRRRGGAGQGTPPWGRTTAPVAPLAAPTAPGNCAGKGPGPP